LHKGRPTKNWTVTQEEKENDEEALNSKEALKSLVDEVSGHF
jgi:hypothetical protein